MSCSKEDNSALIAQYEGQLSNLTTQIAALNNQVSDLNNQLNNIQTENNDLTNTNNSLNEQLETQSSQLETQSSQLETQSSQILEIQSLYDEIQSLYDEIQSSYAALEEEYNSLVETVSTVSIVSLSSQNSLLYEQIDALSAQIETITAQVDVLTLQLLASQLETAIANQEIDSLLSQISVTTGTTSSTSSATSSGSTSSGSTSSGSTSSGSTSSETAASSGTETTTSSENTDEPEPTVQYQLTVNTGANGSVSSTGGTYDSGSSISVSATANSGCVFVNWTDSNGNVLSTNTTYSFNINNDITISANFVEIPRTYVPDDAFEQRLIELGYDDVLDDYVYTNDINNSSVYSLVFNGAPINDVTGLEDFTYLTYLNINGGFTSFSIPETLTSLSTLYIDHTPNLTSLSLSSTVLEQLHFSDITGIGSTVDTSNLPNLREFGDGNQSTATGFTSVDFSNNPLLEGINIGFSEITSISTSGNGINLSANPKLRVIDLRNTPLSGVLDISNVEWVGATVKFPNTEITCLKVRQEQLDVKDELLSSNCSGPGCDPYGSWQLNSIVSDNDAIGLTCD